MSAIKRLWNRNFTILWQGQMISDLGNAAFAVALGFWVLAITRTPAMPDGDLALMGLIEACFAVPAVLLGPFAGVLADRMSRKWIIIFADFLRSVIFIFVGVAAILSQVLDPGTVYFINQVALSGRLVSSFPVLLLIPIAILSGICTAFFGPALSSTIPDIVTTENLSKANSARGLSSTVTSLLGNSFGGVLFAVLGAPVLFLANGISFLYASATQTLMKIPHRAPIRKQGVWHDLRDGVSYTFRNRGIRMLLFTGMLINFFAACGMTLMTPLFDSTPGFGVKSFGYVMATMMVGMALGMVLLSSVRIKPSQRSVVFGAGVAVMVVSMVPIGFVRYVGWIFPLAFISGFTNAIVNVILQTVMQTTVAAEHRGKVFGIMGTVMGGLQPVAMATSGLVARFAGVRPTITACFAMLIFAALPLLFDKPFKAFINTETAPVMPAAETDAPAGVDAPLQPARAAEEV